MGVTATIKYGRVWVCIAVAVPGAMTHLYTRTLGFSTATGPATEVEGWVGRWSNSMSMTSIVALPTLCTRWMSGLSVHVSENTSPGAAALGGPSTSPNRCPVVVLADN